MPAGKCQEMPLDSRQLHFIYNPEESELRSIIFGVSLKITEYDQIDSHFSKM